MRTRTLILAISIAFSPLPAIAEEIGSTMSSSDAIYSFDSLSSFELRAVQGPGTSDSLVVANRSDSPITIQDLNGVPVVIVKPGRVLDLGPVLDRLPEEVVIRSVDGSDGHYVRLTRGLSLTISAREEDAS